VGEEVKLVDSAREVALKVKERLDNLPGLSRNPHPTPEFFVTDRPEKFARVGKFFLGYSIDGRVKKVALE